MPDARQSLAGGLHGRTGSFYTTDLDADSRLKVHALSTAAASSPLLSGFGSVADTGLDLGLRRVYGKMVRWSPDYMAVHGQNVSRRVVVDGGRALLQPVATPQAGRYAGGILSRMSIYDDGFVRYGLLLPDGLFPETIEGANGLLFAGTDFTVMPGLLVTTLDPAIEFPSGTFEVVSGTQTCQSPLAYPTGGDAGPAVARMFYNRSCQSPVSLGRAAAEAAGLVVCRGPDIVADVVPGVDSTTYFWISGAYTVVSYPHTQLQAGQKVESDHVISSSPPLRVWRCSGYADFVGLSWDLTCISSGPPLLANDAGYNEQADAIFQRYAGRLVMVRPGGTIASDSSRLDKFRAYIIRNLPLGAVVIFELT